MALFSFTDIRFTTAARKGFGSNGNLVGGQYDTNIFRYPIDIGSADKGHYMVIHINTQKKTQFSTSPVSGDLPTIFQNRLDNNTPTLSSNLQKGLKELDRLLEGRITANINKATGESNAKPLDEIKNLDVRTIQRTTETIALYMPDTLSFAYNQQYSDLSLSGLPAAVLAAGGSIVDAIKDNSKMDLNTLKSLAQNLTPFVLNAFAQDNPFLRAGFTAVTGLVQNPLLELLYSQPSFRMFRFDFMFYPRSEKEAIEVQEILRRLRFHQAPELSRQTGGYFLIPPSEFDIKFYYNGKENPNIPKISTCVLDSIDVDYAPNGFAAYEVEGENVASIGRTGMPVAIRLSLSFKETEILTKDNYRPPNSSVTNKGPTSVLSSRGPEQKLDYGDSYSEYNGFGG